MDNLDDPRLNFNYRTREHGTVPMDTEARPVPVGVRGGLQERSPHRCPGLRHDGAGGAGVRPDGRAVRRLPGADSAHRGRQDAQLRHGLHARGRSLLAGEHRADRRERQDHPDPGRRLLDPRLRPCLRRLPGDREADGRHSGPAGEGGQAAGRGGRGGGQGRN